MKGENKTTPLRALSGGDNNLRSFGPFANHDVESLHKKCLSERVRYATVNTGVLLGLESGDPLFYSGFHLSEETYRFLSRRPGSGRRPFPARSSMPETLRLFRPTF